MLVSTNNTFLSTNVASIKFIFSCALLCYLWTDALTHCDLITNHLSIRETQHECFGNVQRRNSFLNVCIFTSVFIWMPKKYWSLGGILKTGFVSICKWQHLWGHIFQSFTTVLLYVFLSTQYNCFGWFLDMSSMWGKWMYEEMSIFYYFYLMRK